jgi:hypothetical protein
MTSWKKMRNASIEKAGEANGHSLSRAKDIRVAHTEAKIQLQLET